MVVVLVPGGGGHIEDIDGALSTQYTCFLLVFLSIEIRKIDLTTYNIKMFVESQENC